MNKLSYKDISNHQIIDIRHQTEFQAGHLKNSLNLNLKNFKKYADNYVDQKQPLVFVLANEDKEVLTELSNTVASLGFKQTSDCLLIDDLPQDALKPSETISAKDFLQEEENYILLDVRHPDEITRPAPEKNLVNIPFENLVDDFQSLDPSKKIFTLCGSGNRGTAAASFLESQGFNPQVIEGGMKAIQENQD